MTKSLQNLVLYLSSIKTNSVPPNELLKFRSLFEKKTHKPATPIIKVTKRTREGKAP